MVLFLHPLPAADAPTMTVQAGEHLAPYLNGVFADESNEAAHGLRHRANQLREPPLFHLLGKVGPAPLLVLAGFILVGLTVPRHRGLTTLGALLATSFTLIGVDAFCTGKALAGASAGELSGYQQALLLDRAEMSYFHSARAARAVREMLAAERIALEAVPVAWRLLISAELTANADLYRSDMAQISSGYDHEHAETWYGVWDAVDPDGRRSHIVVLPDPHGDYHSMRWYRAALTVAGVPPGVVVLRKERRRDGPGMFTHVGSEEDMAALAGMAGDAETFLKSDLWRKQIAPALKEGTDGWE